MQFYNDVTYIYDTLHPTLYFLTPQSNISIHNTKEFHHSWNFPKYINVTSYLTILVQAQIELGGRCKVIFIFY